MRQLLLCGFMISSNLNAFAAAPLRFPADVTHGNIRCVLMSVGQTTVFPNEKDRAEKSPPWREFKSSVPCFTMTFLIEALGESPLGRVRLNKLEILSGGRPLELMKPEKIHSGEYQQGFDYDAFPNFLDFTKPNVANPKRAQILRCARFGALPNLRPFSLVIETGFGEDIQKFHFDSIRLQSSE